MKHMNQFVWKELIITACRVERTNPDDDELQYEMALPEPHPKPDSHQENRAAG